MNSPSPSATRGGRAGERLQSLERGLEVLAWMNRHGSGRSGQIARALRLTRSTTHRILSVLVELGLLRLDPASHQYFLDGGVLGLSQGFRDDPWVSGVAAPRLREWTARRGWPLLLVTPVGGVPTVRISTDHDSPISLDWLVPGETMPLAGSAAGALQCAWSMRAGDGQDPEEEMAGFGAPELRAVRRQGYYAAPTACHTGARLGVPLLLNDSYVGCVIMRCLPDTIAVPRECREWATSLQALAASVIEASGPALGTGR